MNNDQAALIAAAILFQPIGGQTVLHSADARKDLLELAEMFLHWLKAAG